MFTLIKFSSIFLFFILLTGCTHKIDITPNNDKITNINYEIEKKDYNVGYYMENLDLLVVSAGGGGDKISYLPYAETESAFRNVLVKHFKKVYAINSISNKEFISNNDIKLIFNYRVNTYSFSDSLVTWPPTKFIITLDCKAVNKDGAIIWEKTIKDEGNAHFDEFKYDFSLAAKRASENVFKKLLFALNEKELKEVKK